jgi:hypothetical protein
VLDCAKGAGHWIGAWDPWSLNHENIKTKKQRNQEAINK